jgi:hypothetical protein
LRKPFISASNFTKISSNFCSSVGGFHRRVFLGGSGSGSGSFPNSLS